MADIGQVIGKVSVRVMPATNTFRGDAQRDLDKIEDKIKAKALVIINEKDLLREAVNAVRSVNKVLRTNTSYKVKFHSTIARETMAAEITKAHKALEDKARQGKVKFNADVAAAVIAGELDQESMKVVAQELKDWKRDNSPVKVGVHVELIPGSASIVSSRLAVLTRPRTVPIVPMLDMPATARVGAMLAALSGARVLKDTFDSLWKSLKRLDQSVPTIGSLVVGIMGLGGYALAAASNLFALSSSLAQIGPAALALPGIFGGMAIGIGASVAVLKDFNKVLPNVGTAFSRLQDQMSGNFWEVAAKPMRQMIWGLLPQLRKGLNQTATELGGFFGTLSTSLKGQFDGALDGMFDDLSESIEIASRHTDSFATILRVLGEVGAGYLPQLAGWIGGLGDQFSKFLSTAQADGSLKRWIDNGIFQMQELGRAAANVGGILKGLATAAEAAGGSNLSMMADTLERVSNVVNGAGFQRNLTDVLMSAHAAMTAISDRSGPAVTAFFETFSRTIVGTLPIIGATIGALGEALFSALANPAVQGGFFKMVHGIKAGVDGLLPAFDAIAPAFAKIMELVGALAANLGPVLGAAFSAVGPAVTTVANALIPIVNMLGPILTSAIEALAPVVTDIGNKLAEVALKAQPLIERIGELLAWLMPVLAPALSFVADVIGNALIGVIDGCIMAFDGIKGVIEGFMTVIDGVVMMFQGDVSGGFAMAWEGIKGIFSGAFEAILGAIKVWLNVGILSFFKGGIKKLLDFWRSGWTGIAQVGKNLWNGIVNFLKAGLTGYVAVWRGAWNGIKTVFAGIWQAMKGVVSTVFNAIRGNVSGAMAGIRNVITGILNAIRGVFSTGWNALKGIVISAFNMAKSAVSSGITGMLNLVKGIPGKVTGALKGMGTLLFDAGVDLIQGFIDGIQSLIGKVTGKLDDLRKLADKLPFVGRSVAQATEKSFVVPDFAKKLKGESKTFYNAGVSLIREMEKGVNANLETVVDKALNVWNTLPKNATKALKGSIKGDLADIGSLIKDFETKYQSIEDARKALTDLQNEANNWSGNLATEIIQGAGDITKSDTKTFAGMKASMQKALSDTKNFYAEVNRLSEMGLNKTSMKQLLEAGPEQGLAYAKALADAGAVGVAEINGLVTDIANAAGDLGKFGMEEIFRDDLNIAESLISNLKDQKSTLVKTIRDIATDMMKAVNKVFKADKATKAEPKKVKKKNKANGRASSLASVVDGALIGDNTGRTTANGNTLIYNAAPGKSLSSEEDLFAAADRGRMVGW